MKRFSAPDRGGPVLGYNGRNGAYRYYEIQTQAEGSIRRDIYGSGAEYFGYAAIDVRGKRNEASLLCSREAGVGRCRPDGQKLGADRQLYHLHHWAG